MRGQQWTTTTCSDEEDGVEGVKDLSTTSLILDEDRGSGRTADEPGGAVAPWVNMQVNAPTTAGATINLMYIVYHTSEREALLGGRQPVRPADVETANASKYYSDVAGVDAPDFTDSEGEGNTALTVKVKSDGDESEQNLWLYETGRFTGRYEGYVRLTDADGDGPDVAGWRSIQQLGFASNRRDWIRLYG